MNKQLIEEAKTYVKQRFDEHNMQDLHYHNWEHTSDVASASYEICKGLICSDQETEIVLLAAIFHDIGYLTSPAQHEVKSAEEARSFLTEREYTEENIVQIEGCIAATELNVEPKTLLQEIICDADLLHLGKKTFKKQSFNLRKEIEKIQKSCCSDKEWNTKNIKFLNHQRFYTSYVQEKFQDQKNENLQHLIETTEGSPIDETKEPAEKKEKKKKKKNAPIVKKSDKGVETLFRISLRNHMSLSAIADSKANNLLSINAIIISIALSALFPKFDNNPYLVWPSFILLFFSVGSIILAIISTLPKVTGGSLNKDQILSKKGNLVFFGNFANMKLEDFEWGIQELMDDSDYLYKTLSRDLYFLGKVLNRKYLLLRATYILFMIGLIISTLSFIISYWTEFHGV